MRILAGFILVAAAFAAVLGLVYGPEQLTTNPLAVVVFLAGAGIGLCVLSLIIAGVLRFAGGLSFGRAWWWSLLPVLGVCTLVLYIIESTS